MSDPSKPGDRNAQPHSERIHLHRTGPVLETLAPPVPRGAGAISQLLDAIHKDPELGRTVRHHEVLPARPPELDAGLPLDPALHRVLAARGIDALYEHQARAIRSLRSERDVVLATPTASGKSLVYSLPTLEATLRDPDARALYIFPLKALEHDQRGKLRADIEALAAATGHTPSVAIYDGDTKPAERTRIRKDPPNVLITTPDMLHLGILPHHGSWERFFESLQFIVVDELHTYRGIFGSHVAQVLRRLDRVARLHGSEPRFIAASATVANPGELASALTGRDFDVVAVDAASRSRRHVLLLNPSESPYTTAARLFRLALRQELRTIAFTKARRVTELLHTWVTQAEPRLASRVSSYRAGFLPEERREIERRLFTGELVGVISTSALEMGIDVGGLDVCILVGYPGSQIATWQRAGRVGRSGDALVAMIAQPDALDQYLVSHPKALFEGAFENAVVDPRNPAVAGAHLPCAAAELPLRAAERWVATPEVRALVDGLESDGELLRSEAGTEWFASRRRPHRQVSLRSAGAAYAITLAAEPGQAPRIVGSIGSANVFTECHAGAIYLHHGRQYRVLELDLDGRTVTVEPTEQPFYTRALTEKETEILERHRERPAGAFQLVEGRVKVTTRVTSYEIRRVRGQELLSTEPLDLPPTSYETTSLWLEMPDGVPAALQKRDAHVMGALHAVEHAALALFPLFALCDRFDVAGITYKLHPQLGKAAIFLYDGQEEGVGLASSVFDRIESLLEATLEMVRDCECSDGCPACVHSPRCGNGNRPIDKVGAVHALELLLGHAPLAPVEAADEPAAPLAAVPSGAAPVAPEARLVPPIDPSLRIVMFDLETQRSAEEVGGWNNAHLMRLALGVTWDTQEARYQTFREAEVAALVEKLASADLVVGFNVNRFDYKVLRGYTDRNLRKLPTYDLLDAIHARIGFRLPLGHLGEETLGVPKSADGLQSLQWWKEGRIEEIERYCQQDVGILRDLFEHARQHEHLIFRTRDGERVRLPISISLPELLEGARVDPHRSHAAPRF